MRLKPKDLTEAKRFITQLEGLVADLRNSTWQCGSGFREDDILADGWDFGSWERGFDDAVKAIEARMLRAMENDCERD